MEASLQRYSDNLQVQWFDTSFIGRTMSFPNHNTKWQLCRQLSEKSDSLINENSSALWAVAAFEAQKITDDDAEALPEVQDTSSIAIIKIYMQIPNPHNSGGILHHDPAVRACQAVDEVCHVAQGEVETLRYLTKIRCASVPRSYDSCQQAQSEKQWVPGGCLFSILMSKVPGQTVASIQDSFRRAYRAQNPETTRSIRYQKNKIAEAFRVAYT